MNANNDPVHTFLMEAHNICVQAQFILGAVRRVVAVIDDPAITEDIRETLIADVDKLLSPLDDFPANPPPPPGASLPRVHTGLPGRPRYSLDLQRALLLHDLGNSWTDISHAMGVDRKTLYRQFEVAGISTARREFTDITDNALDEIVVEISLSHPFVGSVIVSGHLESRGIHLPRLRVQDSLRRVDEIGVLVRQVRFIASRKKTARY
ncbi:Integrase catalytic domain-containing protein [Mycena venus]|uniref:Integrase catalytic domain-containing protein n=1 Tax=Mycena venus TaxID=2733690 RepID=A0A8H7D5C7_9AGAR|nr:Integrase catalytic domain-containing protein [Mycena venus]